MKSLTVIIPCYNEEQSVVDFIVKAFKIYNIDYILVDDGSDIPIEGATIRRNKNKGYGNAIKAGIKQAKGNYIGIIDADSQYDPIELIMMWNDLEDEDMIIGKRISHQGGIKRTISRIAMRCVASFFCLRYIPDINSGSRIFKKHLARSYFSILCDSFSFSTSLTLCFILDRHNVRWLPISFFPREGSPSSLKLVRHGLIALYQIIYITVGLRTRKLRQWLRK